ncbi:MAG: hypothetical protein UX07_C0022G0003 [Parcubacteria group bacterium GW2011_GWA2_45_30]|nr:MAG: hypothetical protein UX07_C0022G0003 [Parcubacteria group bacterium GW2011_GWA2_45_30]
MIDKEAANLDDYLTGLAQELADILSANLLLDHTTTDEAMKRARDIREEIESYGILTTYTGKLSDESFRYQNRGNAPQTQKRYVARGEGNLPKMASVQTEKISPCQKGFFVKKNYHQKTQCSLLKKAPK